ncbi:putative glycine dehydrogenase [decarboxylating] subunit 2 [Gossypium arboreum]|uniref:Uncharacterized protein n=2 Tax=Gossypium arboreum TaxID=29729 RepID=A0ABR0PPW8_GOSAR|nr:uncharacterized protein LOC108485861 [Gossypium arboreum]KAK5826482.1 hypothetical protein PVK06_021404 [Gossypium arboreum]KHG11585.1 putative glycine dehydrogenase [decarboxylating] subunit 2 [Gossypium arboreum]
MGEQIDDAEFWLPSEILMEDDILMEKQNNTELFPYEFEHSYDSFSALSFPVESTVGPAETESSDRDEFLAGLTRRLVLSMNHKLTLYGLSLNNNEANGGLARSAQWTQSNGGSQVAKYSDINHGRNLPNTQNHGFMKKSNQSVSCNLVQTNHYDGRQMKARNRQQQPKQKKSRLKSNKVGERGECSRASFQVQSQQLPTRVILLQGFRNVKTESVGTGVFLPRKYHNQPSKPRKKSGCTMVLVPAKVVQALNLNFDGTNNGFASNYAVLIPRRNANLRQENRNDRAMGSLNLPQDWTY